MMYKGFFHDTREYLRAPNHPRQGNHGFEIGEALAQRSVIGVHLRFHLRQIGVGDLFQRIVATPAEMLDCFTTHIRQARNVRPVHQGGDKRGWYSSSACEPDSSCFCPTDFQEIQIRSDLQFFQRLQIR